MRFIMGERLLTCRACLANEVKLYNIFENGLANSFAEFLGTSVSSGDGLPPYLCILCKNIVQKYNKCKQMMLESDKLLRMMKVQNKLSESHLKSLLRINILNLKTTCTVLLPIVPDEPVLVQANVIQGDKESEEIVGEVMMNEEMVTEEYLIEELSQNDSLTNVIEIDDLNEDDFCYDYVDDDPKVIDEENAIVLLTEESMECDESLQNNIMTLIETVEDKTVNQKEVKRRQTRTRRTKKDPEDDEELALNDDDDENLKNAKLFYISHPEFKMTKRELKRQIKMLDEFSETNNVDVKFLSREEQLAEVEERRQYYKDMPFICELCHKGFRYEDCYKKHMKEHDPAIGDFVCDICGARCISIEDRSMHINCTHLRRFTCKLCGKVTNSQTYARNHSGRHSSAYSCKQCDQGFAYQKNYHDHMRSVHGAKTADCVMCAETFAGFFGLQVHMRVVHKQATQCDNCKSFFQNKIALGKHLNTTVNGICGPDVRPCPACGENFSSETLMRQHYEDLHRKGFKCDRCLKTFLCKLKFASHSHTHIKHGNVRQGPGHICEVCGVGNFKNLSALRAHQTTHSGERPYKCTVCPKAFRVFTGFHHHMNVHNDQRPYKCPTCPKAFRQSQQLKAHLLCHTKERPFACKMCPKRYTSQGSLKEHVDTIHLGLVARRREKQKQITT